MNRRTLIRKTVELLDDLDCKLVDELNVLKAEILVVAQRSDSTPQEQFLQEMNALSERAMPISIRRMAVEDCIRGLAREFLNAGR